jgi:hypothetical protein
MPGSCARRSCSIELIMGYSALERLFAGARHLNWSISLVRFAISLCVGQHPTSDGLTTLNFLAPAPYNPCVRSFHFSFFFNSDVKRNNADAQNDMHFTFRMSE